MMRIRPVIMCGGAGARLWPFSRQMFPKQLLPVVGERTLLQETAARVTSDDFAPPLIVTGDEHGQIVERQLKEIRIEPAAILLEPAAKNTAAVAALAAEWALASGDDELLLLLPSDHFIHDTGAFTAAVRFGAEHAADGAIVMFGAEPREANTQYGYIEAGSRQSERVRPVRAFVEKPNAEAAARYFRSGRHYWNAGIFLARASTLLDELAAHLPATRRGIALAFREREAKGPFIRPEASAFKALDSISIDFAVMQKTRRGYVVPVEMGWSDVGSWSAVWSNSAKDEDNNVIVGDVLTVDTRNSLVRSDGSAVVVTIGLQDVVVVGTKDAVLVAPLQRSDEVKNVVSRLASAGRSCAIAAPLKTSRGQTPPESAGGELTHPIQSYLIPAEDLYGPD